MRTSRSSACLWWFTLNSFISDTKAEYAYIKKFCEDRGCEFALSEVWAKGGEGGIALAEKVMETLENKPTQYHVLYPDEMSLKDKINTIAKEIYGADGASFAPAAAKALKRIEDMALEPAGVYGQDPVFPVG